MMMDGTQREACSNQRDLFPAVEEVAIGWLTVEEDAGVHDVCVLQFQESVEHVRILRAKTTDIYVFEF